MTAILLFGCGSSNSGDTAEGQEEVTTPGSNIEYEQDGSLPPLDKDLQNAEKLSFHPCENTSGAVIGFTDFMRFLDVWGGETEWLEC